MTPAPSRLTVDGDHLTVVQPDGKTSDLSLSQFPEIGALVESIRATLAGDSATLTRDHAATHRAPPTVGSFCWSPGTAGCAIS